MVSAPMHSDSHLTDRFRALLRGGATHIVALRYVFAGGITAGVYLGLGLLLSGPVGLNIQVAIPIAYLLSLVVHFSFQRYFVWAHRDGYALGVGGQGVRYLAVAFTQYAMTALATAVLPSLLGVSEQIVFVVGALLAVVIVFTVMRLHVFHGT
jgi:putative flippase GtrA